MSSTRIRTISLSPEQSGYVDSLVATGAYASAGEVVAAALLAMRDRDETVENWLTEKVGPTFDAFAADPSSAIPADQVFAGLRARHAERLRQATLKTDRREP